MYYTYILYSETTDRYYIGSTSDLQTRLARHNAGATTSTKHGRPWKIAYTEQFSEKSNALKRELQIKQMKSRKYIEALVSGLVRVSRL